MTKKTDGGLRGIFSDHLIDFHWNAIESWSTGHGIPDGEFCAPNGSQAWVEFKKTDGWAIQFKPGQIAWHERRHRMKGSSFIAVRRRNAARGQKVDELYLFSGRDVRALTLGGVRAPDARVLGKWAGGPSKWDWARIRTLLGG